MGAILMKAFPVRDLAKMQPGLTVSRLARIIHTLSSRDAARARLARRPKRWRAGLYANILSGEQSKANAARRARSKSQQKGYEISGLALVVFWAGSTYPAQVGSSLGAETPPGVPAHYQLLYQQDFTGPMARKDFVMTDVNAWKITSVKDPDGAGNPALELAAQSHYNPAVRSPVNIALLADKVFGDFVLEADLRQTGREYGHRDMCLFFGFQDPTHFYYAHIATKADDHAHNVFIVQDAPRTKIAQKTTEGVNWGLEVWRKVRLERKAKEGSIRVFYEDMTTPIMEAQDLHFPSGYVGFGSFDDTGLVDNIRIWGPAMDSKKTEFFARP